MRRISGHVSKRSRRIVLNKLRQKKIHPIEVVSIKFSKKKSKRGWRFTADYIYPGLKTEKERSRRRKKK